MYRIKGRYKHKEQRAPIVFFSVEDKLSFTCENEDRFLNLISAHNRAAVLLVEAAAELLEESDHPELERLTVDITKEAGVVQRLAMQTDGTILVFDPPTLAGWRDCLSLVIDIWEQCPDDTSRDIVGKVSQSIAEHIKVLENIWIEE